MRNVWMFVSTLGVVIGLGAAVYYIFPKTSSESTATAVALPSRPTGEGALLITAALNPLQTASASQLGQWLPAYPIRCGAILYEQPDRKSINTDFCIEEIGRRVATATGVQLTRKEILDPMVQAHWHETMGGK